MAPTKKIAEPALATLDWKEKLVQSGKNASNDATQRRLKNLHEKLKALEQDLVDIKSLDGIKKELLHNTLLLNKDKGVKAYTACCQADLLRLYAPDAPFTDLELKDIFSFMAIQLRTNLKPHTSAIAAASVSVSGAVSNGLGGRITDIPFFGEYAYLLNSLAEIRSICLVPDLPNGDELVIEWFEAMFMSLRTDMSKAMLGNIEAVLTALVEESDTVPEEVVKKLLSQLTDYQERPEHPGFSVAANVIKATAQKLQRYILTYFSDIQLAHARDPSPEDIKILAASHDLLVLLFVHAPESLLNTLPQLTEALLSEELQLRSVTTSTLGRMFASTGGGASIVAGFGGAQGFQSYWLAWLGRRADKSPQVRLAWVESVKGVLETRLELSSQLEAALQEKFKDIDERVRVACCKLFGELDYEVALHNVQVETLKSVARRLVDKKLSVAEQAYESLGQLYSLAFSEIDGNDPLAVRQFAWIPEAIFRSLYDVPSKEQRALADNVAAKHIVPLPSDGTDEVAWVDRLITVTKHMEPRAFDALMALSNLAEPKVRPFVWFIGCCEQYNGGVIDNNATEVKRSLEDISSFLIRHLANPAIAKQHLQDFANANEKRLYKLYHDNADEKTELKTLVKNQNELVRRLKQSQPGILPTFTEFSRKASRWVINRSSIATLLTRAAKSELDPVGIAARQILNYTAKHSAELFRFHVAELNRCLLSDKFPPLAHIAMHALAQLARVDPTAVQKDKKVAERVLTLVTAGDATSAKFAARYLAYTDQGKDCRKGIEAASDALASEQAETLLPSLRATAEFAKSAMKTFHDKSAEILRLAVTSVIEREIAEQEIPRHWTDERDLTTLEQAKILAVRLCIAFCLSVVQDPVASKTAGPYVELLKTILINDGSVNPEAPESDTLASHLRLASALGLMKMARYAVYETAIDEDTFEAIVLVVQDTIFQVRFAFLKKYSQYFKQSKYTSRWLVIPFFTAHDPEPECIDITKQIFSTLRQNAMNPRKDKVEKPFMRLLLALSRHPDFADRDAEDFVDMSKYIRLYVENVVNADNISLLYHVAQRMMTVRDARNPDSEALYMISELVQLMLQEFASNHGWSLAEYRGHVTLPTDLFSRLSSATEAARIRKQSYLPEGINELLAEASHKPRAKRVPQKPAPRKVTPQKRKATSSEKKPAKRAKKTAQVEEEDDDEDESEEESDNEEEEEEQEVDESGMVVDQSEEEVDDGRPEVLGRGGRRAVKVKKRKPSKQRGMRKPKNKDIEASDSELSELSEEDA